MSTRQDVADEIRALMLKFPAMIAADDANAGHMLTAQKHLALAREVLITSAWHLHRAAEELEEGE